MRKLLHKPLLLLMRSKRNFNLKIMGEINLTKINCPAIFVVNHTNSHDIPVASEVIKKPHHVLLGKQPLESIDKIAFWLNGVIWVDRKNKASKAQSKEKIISVLKNGTNILMFPEGTWNRSPNKIMLPLFWGVIDIARESGAPIIPIILEYTPKVCYAKIGEPIYIQPNAEKSNEINLLRDKMATLRYELWEAQPITHRSDLDNDYFKNILQSAVNEYPKLDLEYETSVVRKEYEEYTEAFEHLNNIQPNLRTAFLFNKRIK